MSILEDLAPEAQVSRSLRSLQTSHVRRLRSHPIGPRRPGIHEPMDKMQHSSDHVAGKNPAS